MRERKESELGELGGGREYGGGRGGEGGERGLTNLTT